MTWTIADRMLHIGVSRLDQLGRGGGGIEALRTALTEHDIDHAALARIGEKLLTIADVLYSNDGPRDGLRTRAELALHASLGSLTVPARDFARATSRGDLRKLSYLPKRKAGKYRMQPKPMALGAVTVDAICKAFAAFEIPLRGEHGFEQLTLAGFEKPVELPTRADVTPEQAMYDALVVIASGTLRGTQKDVAIRALRHVHEHREAAQKAGQK